MSAAGFTAPRFVTVLRGYDRLQVDAYVAEVTDRLVATTERTRAAEANATRECDHRRQVEDECTELRRHLAELRRMVATGRATAVDAACDFDAARHQAGEVLAAAEREAARVRERAVRDIEDLRATRNVIIRDLERLRRVLDDGVVIDISDRAESPDEARA